MSNQILTVESLTSACCDDLGYTASWPYSHKGNAWSDKEIAAITAASYLRHYNELPQLPMGGSKHDYRRALKARERKAKELVLADVAPQFGIDPAWATGLLGVLVAFFTGGPAAAIIAIVLAVVQWFLRAEVEKRFSDTELRRAAS